MRTSAPPHPKWYWVKEPSGPVDTGAGGMRISCKTARVGVSGGRALASGVSSRKCEAARRTDVRQRVVGLGSSWTVGSRDASRLAGSLLWPFSDRLDGQEKVTVFADKQTDTARMNLRACVDLSSTSPELACGSKDFDPLFPFLPRGKAGAGCVPPQQCHPSHFGGAIHHSVCHGDLRLDGVR